MQGFGQFVVFGNICHIALVTTNTYNID